jgi:hypothetical protein
VHALNIVSTLDTVSDVPTTILSLPDRYQCYDRTSKQKT